MAVQITPYRGANPLKAIALGGQMRQGQQRLDMQRLQNQRAYEQNQISNRLTQQRIDQAAKTLGMTDRQFMYDLMQDAIATSPNAEQSIQYLQAISPVDRPMAEEAKTWIRNLPPEAFGKGLRQNIPADVQAYKFYRDQLKSDDPVAVETARIKLGLQARPPTGGPQIVDVGSVPYIFDPRTGKGGPLKINGDAVTAEQVGEVERTVAFGKEAGKKQAGRLGDAITEGLLAADSTAAIRRALQLIDSGVDTSRLGQAELAFMQGLGIEDPEAGELSNLLGKAVLSQLRSTFGAAFTENEGRRLEDIEAGFGRNPAPNKRLLQNALQIAERAAERGIKAAEELKDDVAVRDIKAALSLQLGVTPQPNGEDISREELEEEARRRGLLD